MSLQNPALLAGHAARCIERARSLGADEAVVHISESLSRNVQCRDGHIEELNHEHEQGLVLTVYCRKSSGSASCSEWTEKALDEAVDAALAAARHTQSDPDFGLPEAQYMADVDAAREATLRLFVDEAVSMDALIAQAQACEAAALAHDHRIIPGEGSSAAHLVYQMHLADSNGFAHTSRRSRSSVSLAVLACEGQSRQSRHDYDSAVAATGLRSPRDIGETAAAQALAALHPHPIPSGNYPVLIDSSVAAGMITPILQALGGRAQYRGLSFLAGRLGESLLPAWLTLAEQPHLPGFLPSSLHDGEGIATQANAIIEEGRIARYLLGHYSARRLRMPPTGNSGGTVRNLAFIAERAHVLNREDMLREMGTGVLVTRMMGHGANILTGDYSRGAAGFWVENGRIVHPVEGITLAGRLQEMYPHITAIGNDADRRGSIHAPSLLLAPLTVAQ